MLELFDGIAKFGLDKFKELGVYDKPKDKGEDADGKEKAEAEFNIHNYVYRKSFTCPACSTPFKNLVMRTGKIRPVSTDHDLRPIFREPIQPMFYDVISCPDCGYSAISQKFTPLMARQAEAVLKNIKPNFKPVQYPDLLDLDMAIERYQLALLNTIIKGAKSSERAYTCMKLAWLYRSKKDQAKELEYIRLAYTGFEEAYSKEEMPVCGLDEFTVCYLMAAFAKMLGRPDDALRMLSRLIVSRAVNERLKNRARDLKDDILAEKKPKKGS